MAKEQNQGGAPASDPQLALINAKSAADFALTPIGQSVKQFELEQRMAQMYVQSTIVPATYRENIGNAVIAIDMAIRMNANPLMVMQNLYVVNGIPSWSSKFLVATINQSGRYTPLHYEFCGTEGQNDWGCRVVAYEVGDKERKHPFEGTWVTIAMADAEGWMKKPGSKWKTMPELMLRYRAAAFWQRVYCPEIGMGFLTTEEVEDIDDQTGTREVAANANKGIVLSVEDLGPEGPADQQQPEEQKQETKKPAAPKEKPMEATEEIPTFMRGE